MLRKEGLEACSINAGKDWQSSVRVVDERKRIECNVDLSTSVTMTYVVCGDTNKTSFALCSKSD